uniref:Family with sequence similarity 193 member B n=1 Tax=Latimeria chalumnae TaxID=7897 RepID=H3AXA1_LATCH
MTRRKNKQASGRREQGAGQQSLGKVPASDGAATGAAGGERLGEQGKDSQPLSASNQSVQTCCLLCHRERKDWGGPPRNGLVSPSEKLADFVPTLAQNLLGEVPLWICQSCRKSVEEEERRATQEQALAVSLSHTSCKSQICGNGSHSSSSSSSCYGSSVDWDPSSFLSAHKLSGLWNSQHANGTAHGSSAHGSQGQISGEALHSSEHHRHLDLAVPPNSPTGLSSQHSSLIPPKQMSAHTGALGPSQHVHHSLFTPPVLNPHVPASKMAAGPPATVHKPGTCKNIHMPSTNTPLSKMAVASAGCTHPCNGHCSGSVTSQIFLPPPPKPPFLRTHKDQACKGHKFLNGTACHPPQSCEADEGLGEDEDSSSERSSCTSSSTNQKDGKYCDCCYCEFFGHNAPPAAPTSRNYAEIREKLRTRLTKRKEELPQKADHNASGEPAIDHRNVDELLDYINSTEPKPTNSAKAAKRARHKQKKKEKEKAQIEAESQKRASRSPPPGQDIKHETETKLLEWPQLELERVNSFLTSRLEEIKNTIKDSIRASFSMYDLNLDVNDFPKKAATLDHKNLLSHLNGSSDLQKIDLDLSPLTLGSLKNHIVNGNEYGAQPEENDPAYITVQENGDIKRLNSTPNLSRLIRVRSPDRTNVAVALEDTVQGTVQKEVSDLKQVYGNSRQKNKKKQSSQAKKNEANDVQPVNQAKSDNPRTLGIGLKLGMKQMQAVQSTESQRGKNSTKNCEEHRGVKHVQLGASDSAKPENENNETGVKQLNNRAATANLPQPKGKSKKNKNKMEKSYSSIDDVFLPKDLDGVEMDETDREVEYFKRFCLDSAKQTRQKVAVNWSNFTLKKTSSAAQ